MTEPSFDLSDKALLAQIPERHSVRGFTDRPIEGEVRAALLAPTAMNQQKFAIDYDGGRVLIRSLGGPYSAMDLGIVKAHFELGAGAKVA